ncbi:MAG TPA: glycoside hydrolase N-terminal domain-containing protein [Chitinophagaceae bacterium]|nr:glycoside hydrolase N-terminal domain-containing protein [Chitinophagaceae bacterium]
MKRFCLFMLLAVLETSGAWSQPGPQDNLSFDSLATRWDEGMPLGNGWLGALVWKHGPSLRFSLDRADLWDDRPMPRIDRLRFSWIVEQVRKGRYDTVQKLGDEPYELYPAPTKIPGAALELDLSSLGPVISSVLDIRTGLHTIEFSGGARLQSFLHATRQAGYIRLDAGSATTPLPELLVPPYHTGRQGVSGNSVEGQGLERLGYGPGRIIRSANGVRYHQPTLPGHYYEVLVRWARLPGGGWIAAWTIARDQAAQLPVPEPRAADPTGWKAHLAWWKAYWSRSSVSLPDPEIQRQYYLEMYKFACVARSNTPAITLQAVWTADNGNLPPWKGDFHHDLNTELSYWPGYTSNHLDLTASYTNWLWRVRRENERWTRRFFGVDGLNVPGVTTLTGKAMGGWIQYSCSPTTVAWLAQHMYWQWKYSGDDGFLQTRCLPYFREAARYLTALLHPGGDSTATSRLPLSSSPEYFDNSLKAWFTSFTNYDLSLVRSFFQEGREVARAAGQPEYAWRRELERLPDYSQDSTGLLVAPGQPLDQSHRHLSPYMAIYPLCLLDVDRAGDRALVERSIRHLEAKGTRQWCGYSFSWMASVYARARMGDRALRQLQVFARNFCSPNSFHLNGDQRGGEYADATYRPFTLEGNFAFAQGVHELLIQTRDGVLEVFPALPSSWKTASFTHLRAQGAFLVSAAKENGLVTRVEIQAEKGGPLRLRMPFATWTVEGARRADIRVVGGVATLATRPGQHITFKNAYE